MSLREIWRVATLPAVPSLLTVKLLTGMALAVFHSAFPLVVTTRFGLDAKGSGYVMSYSGLLGMFAQAVVVQWATARYDDRRIIAICIAGLSASFLGLMLASTTAHLCLVMVPFAVFGSLLSTVNTAQLTKAAPADMGTIVSLDMSVGSGVRVVSPTVSAAGGRPLRRASRVEFRVTLLTCRRSHSFAHTADGDDGAVAARVPFRRRDRLRLHDSPRAPRSPPDASALLAFVRLGLRCRQLSGADRGCSASVPRPPRRP